MRKAIEFRWTGACAILLAGTSGTAIAQSTSASTIDQPPAQTQVGDVQQDSPVTANDEIVVTGSRLQSGFTAPTPVTVVGEARIENRAPSNVAELVNELPAFRQSAGQTQAQRVSQNQNTLDLRGLGSSRTLLLIDGRRQTTSDTNTIPVSLIDRVEVVTGGASAAYGSDAVAGVANFILRKDLDGVRANLQTGISQYGDNAERVINIAAGTTFADNRIHVIAGFDYSQNDGVGTIYRRDWSRVQPNLVANGSPRAAGVPAQSLLDDITYATQSAGGVINSPNALRGVAFGPGGSLYPFQYGTVIGSVMQGGSNPLGSSNGNWPLKVPLKRIAGLGRIGVDLSENVSVFAEVAYADVTSHGYTSFFQQPSLIIPTSSPYIPAALRPLIPAGTTSITIGRFFTELGGFDTPNYRQTFRAAGGIDAKLFGNWKLNAYYQYAKTTNLVTDATNIATANFRAAAYTVPDANGNPICGPIATNPNLTAAQRAVVQPGCQPLNLFGVGAPSAAALAYVQGNGVQNRNDLDNISHIVAASVNGTLFSTWAGPVEVAFGGEARWDTEIATSDELSRVNGWAATVGSEYSGKQQVKEAFAEFGVPLVRGAAWTKSLELNGAVRRTDYQTSGAVTTWKLGATWEPTDWLRLRGTRSRDIRAPGLRELYRVGGGGTFAGIVNPINGQTGSLASRGAGNSGLVPEVADTWTGGVVLSPPGSGLRFSADYFNINLEGVIATPSVQDVLQRCAQKVQAFCDLIVFDNSIFGITAVVTRPENLNRLKTDGLDFEFSYRTRVGEGTLDLHALATHIFHLTTVETTGATDRAGSAQNGGIPSWVGNAELSYEQGPVIATLGARYFNAMLYDASFIGPDDPKYNPALSNSINDNTLPGRTYFDLSLRFNVVDGPRTKMQFYTVVSNLLDKDPPSSSLVLTSGNPYDVVGRTFKFGVRSSF